MNSEESIEKVVQYFLNNPTATNQEISASTGVSKSSVQRYLTKPNISNIKIPSTNRTIAEQILWNTRLGRQRGGRNTFQKYDVKKDESGKFVGLEVSKSSVDKGQVKNNDIMKAVLLFSKNPFLTIDELASLLGENYTSDYVYDCLKDSRIEQLFGTLIASSITQQLEYNRYGILRKFRENWGDELFNEAGLSDREKEILNCRFSEGEIGSAESVASRFGVSKTMITKIENRAFRKLQEYQAGIYRK